MNSKLCLRVLSSFLNHKIIRLFFLVSERQKFVRDDNMAVGRVVGVVGDWR